MPSLKLLILLTLAPLALAEPYLSWSAKEAPTSTKVKPSHGSLGFLQNAQVKHYAGKPSYFFFDGNGAKKGAVLLGDQQLVSQLPTKEITIEAWVKIKKPLKWGGILSTAEDNRSYERGFVLGFHQDTFYWGIAATGTNPIKLTYLKSKASWVPNEWYHVVATYDGTTQNLFIDGKLSGSSKIQQGEIKYAEKFYFSIGAYWDQNEKYSSNMELESLSVWKKAISADEVQSRFKTRNKEFPGVQGTSQSTANHKDWPSYKRDNRNTAHYPHNMPKDLHLQWIHQPTKAPKQAWPGTAQSDWWRKRGTPEPEKGTFDKAFELVAAKGKVYFGSSSDDHVYCLEQASGKLLWKFATEGPVRLAPTIHEGKVLFGSDDGSVYCLNAETGAQLWRTSLPQVAERKLAGNGRMISLYPVRTNILVQGNTAHFGCGLFPKNAGAWYASVDVNSGKITKQNPIKSSPQGYMEESNGKLYTATGRHPAGAFLTKLQKQGKIKSLAAVKIPKDYQYAFIRANNVHIGGGKETVAMLDSENGNEIWSDQLTGTARSLALSNDQLLVSTDAGFIYCYGKKIVASPIHHRPILKKAKPASDLNVKKIIAELPSLRGYALVLDTENKEFIYQLAKTEMQLIVLSNTDAATKKMRNWLWNHGLYGQVVVHQYADLDALNYTKKSFNLITSSKPIAPEKWQSLVRPNTGIIMSMLDKSPVYKAPTLKGAGSWTHMYANPGNTACSGDQNVGSKLALQWFGRPGPEHIMDRHLRPPPPLVHNGVMVVPGRNYAIGVDTWNGTILWEKPIPDFQRIGAYRDSGNMVLSENYVYCVTGSECKILNVYTGKILKVMKNPLANSQHEWGYIGTIGKRVIGTSVKKGSVYRETSFDAIYKGAYGDKTQVTTSDVLFANHYQKGTRLWLYEPKGSIINPTIALNSKSAIFIESSNPETLKSKTGRQDYPELITEKGGKLMALTIATGKPLWNVKLKDLGDVQTMHVLSTEEKVILLYSHNKLLANGKTKKVHYTTQVYNASDGKLLWSDTQTTKYRPNLDHGEQDLHPALVGNQLIAEPHIYDLNTGKIIGKFNRVGYGCGTISASSASLFYRAGNLASYDIKKKKREQITSVSRPGCWINMIPASGMLIVPEGSSGCICKFAIQSSMGFVPVEEEK